MRVSGHCLDMTVAHQLSNPAMKMPIGLGRAMMDNKKTLCRLSCTMTLRGRWARFTRMREGREKKDMWFQVGGGGRICRKRMGEWPQSCRTRAFLFIEQ